MVIRASTQESRARLTERLLGLMLPVGGVAAILWSLSVLPYFNVEQDIIGTANMVRRGKIFSPEMVTAASKELAADLPFLRPAMLPYAGIVGMMNLEHVIAGRDAVSTQPDVSKFETFTKANLTRNPTDGFAWLSLFWLDTLDNAEPSARGYDYLRMSYRQTPNEGWIAEKRNPLVLRYFQHLPADVAEAAVSEFVHLVRSFLYGKAAEILAGAPPEARDVLLRGLNVLSDEQRTIFAAAMRERQPEDTRERPVPQRPWQ